MKQFWSKVKGWRSDEWLYYATWFFYLTLMVVALIKAGR